MPSPNVRPSTLRLPPGPWSTLLDGLCARFPAIDRATWLDRLARGRVTDADGHALNADTPYQAGELVRYFREVPQERDIPFEERVLYQDDHLVVADKPHFLPVMPAGEYVEQTLQARLTKRLGNPHLVPIHRIDRHTAGLVLFSCEPSTRGAYQALFREREVHKRYEAVAAPLPQLDFPLVRRTRLEPGEPFFRMCETDGPPNSETRLEVIERGSRHWRYALYPVTGRKHQLRVQMAGLGAGILHDLFYPELLDARDQHDDHARPLQLLARALAFRDPLSGRDLQFESELKLLPLD
ncbi:ribosomal large subunit pseudouridine synthase D [Pseudomonas sp. SLBN-26]|uniref:pseudouridine synthase n=1 Tax=Pseudomonadaceae TaxID=135621 RepID=UPI00114EB187|nr:MULTISPECIES: pseudouridine synthase [Pseudomonas]MCP1615899.1 tRNA pseudouridine32 synthase/23S rRNA pseudouridine746 synthase [Pseudomonas otitidis]TQL05166.1 ribosomal large subunit pseudouridine synthase D [Pseudomonas sp. SLBN-26]